METGERTIALTCGDPSGLGPELIERCMAENKYAGCRFLAFGDASWLERLTARSRNPVEARALSEKAFEPGRPRPAGARLAIEAMGAAAAACSERLADAVVTGPIAKGLCAAEGFRFPGQTEFFAAQWGGLPTMAFVGERLRVTLATWHVPLSEVGRYLTKETFQLAVRRAWELGRGLGLERPRLAVCGLNPHAGEGGLLGTEERDLLDPWLVELAGELPRLGLCQPGDTVFMRALKGEADVVVALYHDQGLAPFKAVDFDSGVNVTLGLPHLRTSPDHGTGFEIAGQGLASPGSMHRAISLAATLRPVAEGGA